MGAWAGWTDTELERRASSREGEKAARTPSPLGTEREEGKGGRRIDQGQKKRIADLGRPSRPTRERDRDRIDKK